MRYFLALFLLACFSNLEAQVYETTPPEYIRTIEFQGESEFSGTPIIQLGSPITIEFDDLVGDEADYYYTIEHYNFDWTPSNLSKNEYMDGFDDLRILNYQNSFNTLQIYSHYRLTIPNRNTRGLKVSGNYMLRIFNENDELVFSRKFMVYEDIAIVRAQVKRSRDLKFIDTKQVINFSVDGTDNLVFRNPDKNLKTLLIKNNNLSNSIYDLKPQYSLGNEFIYRYDQPAAFWGGNEYLNFDNKDVRSATMNIRSIQLIDIYNTYLYTDGVRAFEPYTYNPDINGHFVVRTLQGEDPDIEAEYTWVHFGLQNFQDLNGGELHIYGNFNNFTLDESTKLTYNSKKEIYETKRLFKQGFYNYKYVLLQKDGTIDEGFISGNFDETENQYTVLVYYRDIGGRYDRIIGVGSANSRNISN
ncbi:type IX secretion system plug protein [Mesonia maritima]|uniref:Type 9 secretion system plug protein N-terminal domain-containing protein n=1 Tax=Mesonia maritima TaxID=1793873 RepID=A0ABU1K6P2_9FLAO|nr:DUF5103 domain-containing protein [Mesonia maritima]MDR6301275.1 hypothetical protein [Mesonia maritima]